MYNSNISEDLFSVGDVPDQCKTQKICHKTVDDCIATLKFVPDWLVTRKVITFLLICTQMKYALFY